MKVDTLQFGEILIDEQKIITFPCGIPGFEELRLFTLLQPEDTEPFAYLQSLENGSIAFLIANPFLLYRDYSFQIPEAVQKELRIEKPEQVSTWSVVTVKDSGMDATINLLAPLIIHVDQRLGKQIVLYDSGYATKHPLNKITEQQKE